LTAGLTEAWDAYKENALKTAEQVKSGFETFTSGLEDAFVKMVQTGKLSFKDLANSILADLARIAFKKAVVGMASLFGFAAGGQVMADTPIIVGERGPELFVPRTAGAIVPNNALGGMAGGAGDYNQPVTVNYNIQAVDAASFRSLVARDPSFIYAVTEQGRRSQPTRSR
jgi:lambda family phage tail tape measure protein